MTSSDGKSKYEVTFKAETCQLEPNCVPHCKESPCQYLCCHMVTCACYDYQHGHLCKHTHRVYSIHQSNQQTDIPKEGSSTSSSEQVDGYNSSDDVVYNGEEEEAKSQGNKFTGIRPSKSTQDQAGNIQSIV